jgi:hypothetical protein
MVYNVKKPTKELLWNEEHNKSYRQLYDKLVLEFPTIKKENYIEKFNKMKLLSFIKKLEMSLSTRENTVLC